MKDCYFVWKMGGGFLLTLFFTLTFFTLGCSHGRPTASEESSEAYDHRYDGRHKRDKHHDHYDHDDEYDEEYDDDFDTPDAVDSRDNKGGHGAGGTRPDAAGKPGVQAVPSPKSQCKGPGLITKGGKSICLSCHERETSMRSSKVHREHNGMGCCECHK